MPVDGNADIARELGALDAKVGQLEADLSAIKGDMREMRDALITVRGGWKILLGIVAASGTIGALSSKLLPLIVKGN